MYDEVAAALHNLFEWSIVMHVWKFGEGNSANIHVELFNRLSKAALFIGTVITVCMVRYPIACLIFTHPS